MINYCEILNNIGEDHLSRMILEQMLFNSKCANKTDVHVISSTHLYHNTVDNLIRQEIYVNCDKNDINIEYSHEMHEFVKSDIHSTGLYDLIIFNATEYALINYGVDIDVSCSGIRPSLTSNPLRIKTMIEAVVRQAHVEMTIMRHMPDKARTQ